MKLLRLLLSAFLLGFSAATCGLAYHAAAAAGDNKLWDSDDVDFGLTKTNTASSPLLVDLTLIPSAAAKGAGLPLPPTSLNYRNFRNKS